MHRGGFPLLFSYLLAASLIAGCSSGGDNTGSASSAPIVSLTANPSSVPANGSSVLTWSVQSALECEASGGWSGPKDASGTVTVGPLTVSTVYILTCSGFGGITTQAVTVAVDGQPPPPAPTVSLVANATSVGLNGSTTLTWSSTNADGCQASDGWSGLKATSGSEVVGPLTTMTTFTLVCNGAGGSAGQSVAVTVDASPPPPAPTVSLAATPLQVVYNGQSTLAWSSTDATSCVASGDWTGTKSTSGSETVGPLTATSTFILDCSGAGGDAGQSVTVTVQSPPNQAPVANADSATTQQDVTVIIDVLANDTDADVGDTLTVGGFTQPTNGSVVNNNTNVTYTPNLGFSGSDTFTYTATDGTAASNSATVTVTVTAMPPVTFIGAGDIASENWSISARHELTAQLIEQAIAADPNTIVWTAGDNAYSSGTPTEFTDKYNPSWGRVRDRTYPVAGNHDWGTANAQGYLDYFCPGFDCRFPGAVQRYWYSYDVGNNWHVVMVDSQYDHLDPTQDQYEWIKLDLQANTRGCIVAIWHHPRFASSSNHPSDTRSANLWALLQSHGADLVLNGHNHHYERFAKQDSSGNADPSGMIQITAGTGGAGLYAFTAPIANSVVRIGDYGVLKLTLRDTDYDWQFINLTGQVLDSGTETCD